jgi:hypothetical protein
MLSSRNLGADVSSESPAGMRFLPSRFWFSDTVTVLRASLRSTGVPPSGVTARAKASGTSAAGA